MQASKWRTQQDVVLARMREARLITIVDSVEIADLVVCGTLFATPTAVLAHVKHRVTHIVYTAILLPLRSIKTQLQVSFRDPWPPH